MIVKHRPESVPSFGPETILPSLTYDGHRQAVGGHLLRPVGTRPPADLDQLYHGMRGWLKRQVASILLPRPALMAAITQCFCSRVMTGRIRSRIAARMLEKIIWISEKGSHVRVFGHMTGLPTKEITVVDPPAAPSITPPDHESKQTSQNPADINVLLTGKRLEITADVHKKGLDILKQMLDTYAVIYPLTA